MSKILHKIENETGLLKDKKTGAVLASEESYTAYKRKMKDIEEIRFLKQRINNLEYAMTKLLEELRKS